MPECDEPRYIEVDLPKVLIPLLRLAGWKVVEVPDA